jgi:hypothetical protein
MLAHASGKFEPLSFRASWGWCPTQGTCAGINLRLVIVDFVCPLCSLPEILCLWASKPHDLAVHNVKHSAGQLRGGNWARRKMPAESAAQAVCSALSKRAFRKLLRAGHSIEVSECNGDFTSTNLLIYRQLHGLH